MVWFNIPSTKNPNDSEKFKVIKKYIGQVSPLVSKTFIVGDVLEGNPRNKDKQPIKATKVWAACFAAPCPPMWERQEDTAFVEVKLNDGSINIPIEYLQEIRTDLDTNKANSISIAEAAQSLNLEKSKLIAQQNAAQAKVNLDYKNNFIIRAVLGLAALTVGYFAYKKFNK